MFLAGELWGSLEEHDHLFSLNSRETARPHPMLKEKNCIFNQYLMKVIRSPVRESKSVKAICNILFTEPASLKFCFFFFFTIAGNLEVINTI